MDMEVGVAAMVIAAGADGANVSIGLILRMFDSELSVEPRRFRRTDVLSRTTLLEIEEPPRRWVRIGV